MELRLEAQGAVGWGVLPAILLAAGESSRMGFPKALLRDPDGRIFVARIVASLHEAGVREVAIVTGRHHEPIAAALAAEPFDHPVRVVRNEDPSRGQLSSLWTGMDAVCHDAAPAVVVTLVDVPMVTAPTIRAVIDAWQRTAAPIVRPRVGERRGHPVIFDRAVFGDLRRAPLEGGARTVVRARRPEIVEVAVDDPGCIRDVDTPAEYESLVRKPGT